MQYRLSRSRPPLWGANFSCYPNYRSLPYFLFFVRLSLLLARQLGTVSRRT